MIIKVTDEDIKNGKQGSNYCCPIALACSKHFGEEVKVNVTNLFISICPKDPASDKPFKNFDLDNIKTNIASSFSWIVDDFDRTGKMVPFELELI